VPSEETQPARLAVATTKPASSPEKRLVMPYLMAMCKKSKCNIERARQGALANHFKLRHPNMLKTEEHWECCAESFQHNISSALLS
jgi:hypothetical protein